MLFADFCRLQRVGIEEVDAGSNPVARITSGEIFPICFASLSGSAGVTHALVSYYTDIKGTAWKEYIPTKSSLQIGTISTEKVNL